MLSDVLFATKSEPTGFRMRYLFRDRSQYKTPCSKSMGNEYLETDFAFKNTRPRNVFSGVLCAHLSFGGWSLVFIARIKSAPKICSDELDAWPG
jgi:hypothetical protein